ncbi:rho guanine nucleotide exchange factor 7 [Parasteatoda tepidariorum]|uniref:rho guanine nucleotide exchange factor 7 n=1 Tax=Parasteatoda tepidariorum TaxID=114398 RepID=UPI00077F964E|nr:rho guanine nucleotide exchange factor 7 [Parasteatoda tepidariorum]
MTTEPSVHLVKALYDYKASNNDELCLKKGDVVTVTQALEGGWWEGTLNGVTGWFPSNYVKELKTGIEKSEKYNSLPIEVPSSPNLNDVKLYREIVFQDIMESENEYLSELQFLVNNYVLTLKGSDILTEIEYNYLVNNLEDVCACSVVLVHMLEDVKRTSPENQRIGAEFIRVYVYVKKIFLDYASGHPKAVAVIEKHKKPLEDFMEKRGAPPPGLLTLITGLSKPFRRLEKYAAALLELLRHTQESHIDRGDTQRAASLYSDIANVCSNVRKQKEMELEIISGNIQCWEGEGIHTLGNIVYMGTVTFLTDDQQKSSQFLVLFPETLVILSAKIGTFTYEGRLPLYAITVRKIEPSEGLQFAFEINGNLMQRIIVICPSPESFKQWMNSFPNHIIRSPVSLLSSRCSTLPRANSSQASQMQTSYSPAHSTRSLQTNSSRSISPEDKSNRNSSSSRPTSKKFWTNWNLRPHPPLRASLTLQNEVKLRRNNSCNKEKDHESEGDIPVRHMMETLNIYDRTRNTLPLATASAPPRLNFVEDKIIIDGFDGDGTEIKEKSLVDTVYMLKDQILELKGEVATLNKALQEETKARKKLENFIKQNLPGHESTSYTSLDG